MSEPIYLYATVRVLVQDAEHCWSSPVGRCWYLDTDTPPPLTWCTLFDDPVKPDGDKWLRCARCKKDSEALDD